MTNFGRMPLEMRRRTHLLRKTPNKFFQISHFRKNIVYSVNISAQRNDKIWIFFQEIRREKLYKNYMNQIPTDLFWWFLRSLKGPPCDDRSVTDLVSMCVVYFYIHLSFCYLPLFSCSRLYILILIFSFTISYYSSFIFSLFIQSHIHLIQLFFSFNLLLV